MIPNGKENPAAPKISFPCKYPIRIMGAAAPDFKDFVLRVVKKHAPEFNGAAEIKSSKTGKYLSIHVIIQATGTDQLTALHEELKSSGRVQMVL